MSAFDKKFGDFTVKMLRSKEVCRKSADKNMCRETVSIYSEDCKKCFEEEKKNNGK